MVCPEHGKRGVINIIFTVRLNREKKPDLNLNELEVVLCANS